jgi:UDP-N-acetylglucosamine 2-epimerase (non-hydrolysing)
MIDSLVNFLPKASQVWLSLAARFPYDRFVLVTLHRPSNVDIAETLGEIISALDKISLELPVLFPLHPRTKKRIKEFNLQPKSQQLIFLEPMGYLEFLAILIHATLVLTDSGGIQEETTYLGIPCLTARANTERPVTITLGTNELVETTTDALLSSVQTRLKESKRSPKIPPLWDGEAASRVIKVFEQIRYL